MGRVLTNATGFQYAAEASVGVLPGSPTWYKLEPNQPTRWGREISRTARAPISKDRQRRKGAVTDSDSAVGFDLDFTLSHFIDFIEAFCFATAVNSDCVFRGVDADTDGFIVPSTTAAQAAKLQWTSGGPISLLYARGYANDANNGLIPLSADVGSAETSLEFDGAVAETAPAKAIVEVAGIRAETGDLSLSISSGVGTLSSGNNGASTNIDFTTLGLTVGQFIHIGGLTSSEQFSAGYGYARVTAIAAGALTLDKLDSTLADDTGAAETIDILFGRFIRNVSIDDAAFIERSYHVEAAFENLGSGGATEYEYAKGNYANEFSVQMGLSDKALISLGFIGTDTEDPTATRKTNAANGVDPVMTEALNTSSDIMRLRVTEVDETGLTTDFKNARLTVNNEVSPEKVLGSLGAAYMNYGNFLVGLEGEIIFTNKDVITAINNNTTVTAEAILKNSDGAIVIDFPSLTLGDGQKNFPVNESVTVRLSGEAFKDDTLETSLGVSLFPVAP